MTYFFHRAPFILRRSLPFLPTQVCLPHHASEARDHAVHAADIPPFHLAKITDRKGIPLQEALPRRQEEPVKLRKYRPISSAPCSLQRTGDL
jgi:hypothetical protein